RGIPPEMPEALLRPGSPLFEYWGHEASWIPKELYSAFGFRRKAFQRHPWWGDVLGDNPRVASSILDRIHRDGPLRSSDLEGKSASGWWKLSVTKQVLSALWSSGVLAVRERRNFQRTYDLAERVIEAKWRRRELELPESLKILLLKALDGHGWATLSTLSGTWRLRFLRAEVQKAIQELEEEGAISKCVLLPSRRTRITGWIRPEDLDLAERLRRVRLAPGGADDGILLSPFDPLLWDRARVRTLFGFHQVLEIFTPAPRRKYGYYCMPVLAGERLVARCDVKSEKASGVLRALSIHFEDGGGSRADRRATRRALDRYAGSIGLALAGRR
ncbi:MAG TPA: crosslink repair DNA glycosylase YcaQ family protein, partial [Vicinamibacteria bacterium]|nr:crosslink repair DNA glycosylase YcaQ family protein [Vicinamibacteria bacterium]